MYKNKYLKYKNKYLTLKNQIGGTGKIYILPDELTYDTKAILTSKDTLKNTLDDMVRADFGELSTNNEYLQDPFIFVINKNDNTRSYINTKDINEPDTKYIKSLGYTQITIPTFKGGKGINYGGNFISSPPLTDIMKPSQLTDIMKPSQFDLNQSIFYISGIDDILKQWFETNLYQNICEIECNFRFNNERHIDELMCFMPYKNVNGIFWKIWMYEFENKTIDESDLIKNVNIINDYYINNKEIINNPKKRGRDGKTPDLMDMPLPDDSDDEPKSKKSKKSNLDTDKNKYKLIGGTYNIDTIYENIIDTLTKLNLYKKLNPINENVNNAIEYLNATFHHYIINKEHDINININNIIKCIFGENELVNKQKIIENYFVFFPITIKMTSHNNYKIIETPIFNRILIKNEDSYKCIFPVNCGVKGCTKYINRDQNNFIFSSPSETNLEEKYLKKIKDEKTKGLNITEYKYINTYEFNMVESTIGGNIHCLLKNVY